MIGKALIIECIALSLAAGSREKILKKKSESGEKTINDQL